MGCEQEIPGRGVHGQDSPQLLTLEGVVQHAEEGPQGTSPPIHFRLLPHSANRLVLFGQNCLGEPGKLLLHLERRSGSHCEAIALPILTSLNVTNDKMLYDV